MNVIIYFEAKSEFSLDFANLMQKVKVDLPEVEGCLGIEVYRDCENLNRFTLVEKWDNKTIHEKHLIELRKSGAWDSIVSMLVREPESSYFNRF